MVETAFCKTCCELRPFTIDNEVAHDEVYGIKFAYNKKVCRCSVCRSDIYVYHIANENIDNAFIAYHAAKDAALGSSQEIHAQ